MFSKIIFVICLVFYFFSAGAEEQPTRIGYAYDKETEKLLYTESHYENYSNGLILNSKVVYKDPEKNVIANKIVDFTINPFMPAFSLNNIETGHKEETRFVDDEYEIVFSKAKAEPVKDSVVSYPPNAISDAGFDNFIIKYWDEIVSGEMFKRDFLIPSMMEFIKFKIYQDDILYEDGLSLRRINIEPDSFFVRLFAGTTRLYYDEHNPTLKKFDGVSNMRDGNGNNYKVIIRYKATGQQFVNF